MAVTRVLAASMGSGAVISNTAARVSAVHVILPTDGTSANTFVMLYDKATAPSGGTDTPDVVYKVAIPSAEGNIGMRKLIFPGGGDRFSLGVGLFVATTFNGATGVTTTAPYAVDVFFETGN